MIPPLPKSCDVENRGHLSAGRPGPTKETSEDQAHRTPDPTATYGTDVEGDGPP